MRSVAFLLFFICVFFNQSYSQSNPYSVKGVIQDSTDNSKMQNVTVQLSDGKNKLLQTTITDKNGAFRFPVSSGERYTLTASYTGYKPVSTVVAGNTGNEGLLINMRRSEDLLKDVSVNATKETETHTASKIVVNIASSAIASGGNSFDALTRLPGATSYGNTLLFRGRQTQVLIDGKPSGLKGEELKNYLSALPANTIDKIEVLQNASAKNDAEGNVIIDIKTLRNKTAGFTGSLTGGIGLGTYVKANGGGVISYKDKKINAFLGYDYVLLNPYYLGETLIRFNNGVTQTQNDYEVRKRDNHSLRAGFDYSINKWSRVSVFFRGYSNSRSRDQDAITRSFSAGHTSHDSSSSVVNAGFASYKSPSVNLSYIVKTDTSGSELNMSVDYFKYSRNSNDSYHTKYFDHNDAEFRVPDVLTASSPAANSVKSISVDWTRNAGHIKFETGIRHGETVIDNDIVWRKIIGANSSLDTGKTNHYIYKENVDAAYVSMTGSTKKISYQFGLRMENTKTTGSSLTTGEITNRNYLNLFPSLNFQVTLAKGKEMVFGYRRSIQRPAFNILNPFVNYITQYYYIQGNPLLQPTKNNSINLSYSYKSSLILSVNYTLSENPVIASYTKNPVIDGVISSNINGSSSQVLSPNLTIVRKFAAGKFVTTNNIGLTYTTFADQQKYNFGYSSALSGYASTTNTLSFGKGCSMEMSANYTSATITASERFKPQYSVNIGVSCPLMKSRGALKINVVDIFNTQVFRYTAINSALQNNYYYKIESRFFNINFTYKFGNNNIKVNTNKKTGIDEEKSRI